MTAQDYADQIRVELGNAWLPRIYRERILKMRTRAYRFESLKPNTAVRIQHTLLGVELKTGKRRLLLPDLASARYLSIFARLGCSDVAIPYDITKVSLLADELESSWHRMLLLAEQVTEGKTTALRTRTRGLLIAQAHAEITAAGPGRSVPEFKESTRQRS